jgi:hypothetical protein
MIYLGTIVLTLRCDKERVRDLEQARFANTAIVASPRPLSHPVRSKPRLVPLPDNTTDISRPAEVDR